MKITKNDQLFKLLAKLISLQTNETHLSFHS